MTWTVPGNYFSDEFEGQIDRSNKIKYLITIWIIVLFDIPVIMYLLDFKSKDIIVTTFCILAPIIPFV